MEIFKADYWQNRYENTETQWDLGHCSRPLSAYFRTLENTEAKILIPGCGAAYEAEFLHRSGFTNVYVADWACAPLEKFQERFPEFPSEHLLQMDFFEIDQKFDIVIEQTFFCALPPAKRPDYAKQLHKLLSPKGVMAGLMFNFPLTEEGPAFGGSEEEYRGYFEPYFEIGKMTPCNNSEPKRQGRELFVLMRAK